MPLVLGLTPLFNPPELWIDIKKNEKVSFKALANRNKAKLFSVWIRTKEHISQVGDDNQFIALK